VRAKPVASLAPSLLARKGGARPAMRLQLKPLQRCESGHPEELDDLGWNDMGYTEDAPAPALAAWPHQSQPDAPAPRLIETVAKAELVAPATQPKSRAKPVSPRRVAVSLKVDAQRHLQLRLASMITHRSAQQLVIQALDRLLDEVPGLNTMLLRLNRT
jgi:hypothetical protein